MLRKGEYAIHVHARPPAGATPGGEVRAFRHSRSRAFGTLRPRVQIPPSRPKILSVTSLRAAHVPYERCRARYVREGRVLRHCSLSSGRRVFTDVIGSL